MCRFFKITYACEHRDVIKTPCQWRDEGMIDIHGEVIPCDKSSKKLKDFTRDCMACSPRPVLRYLPDSAGQDLINLNSLQKQYDVEAYLPLEQKAVMAIIVRNEGYLRKRIKVPSIIQAPPISLDGVSKSDIQYQCCLNDEFLARRLKKRCFQHHLNGRSIDYQVYLEAVQAHLDAKAALNNSLFTLHDFSLSSASTRNVKEAATQSSRILTGDSLSQTDYIEETAAPPPPPVTQKSDDSAETIIPSRPRELDTISPPISQELDYLTDSIIAYGLEYLDLDTYRGERQAHRAFHLYLNHDVDNEESRDGEPLEGEPAGCRVVDLDDDESGEQRQPISNLDLEDEDPCDKEEASEGETAGAIEDGYQEAQEQDQFSEWSSFVGDLSNDRTGEKQESAKLQQGTVPLDSPEGAAQLVDIRSFLGMSPDARPLEIWNFVQRNGDLAWYMEHNTPPLHRRYLGSWMGTRFQKDLGLETLLETDDEKWEIKNGFSLAWKSLRWTFDDEGEFNLLTPSSSSSDRSWGDMIDSEDDDEEECDSLVCSTVWYNPSQLVLMKHRCRVSSPLRTSLTRRDSKGSPDMDLS